MSDKLLRVTEAATLYNNVREKIDEVNTKLSTKIDSAEVSEGYLILKGDGNIIASLTGFGGGGGGGGSGSGGYGKSVITITSRMDWTATTIAYGRECAISFYWDSLETDGKRPTGTGTLSIIVNGETKYTQENYPQGYNTIDVGKYLITGLNGVRIFITDVYGNSSFLAYQVTANSYTITSDFNKPVQEYRGDINFTYTVVGVGTKTVHFFVKNSQSSEYVELPSVTVQEASFNSTYVFSKDVFTHGSTYIKVYYTVNINGKDVPSNELIYNVLYIASDSPVLASSFNTTTASQYDQLTIPYVLYATAYPSTGEDRLYARLFVKYGNLETDQYVQVGDDTFISDKSEKYFFYTIENGNPRGNEIDQATGVAKNYNVSLKIDVIKIGTGESVLDAPFIATVSVTPAESTIVPVTTRLDLHLSANGKSNSSANRDVWEYGDIKAEFINFNWDAGGWYVKKETILNGPGSEDDSSVNNTVLRVNQGSSVYIPFKAFEDPEQVSRTIEFEFSTENVDNYDTTIIECMDNIGLVITAQEATFKTKSASVYSQFKEEEHVRVSIAIEAGNSNNDSRLMYIYVNGIMSGVVQHPSNDIFYQSTPKGITIGSEEATVDIYNIRIYNSCLTRDQIVQNWIADKQDGTEKSALYKRNKLYAGDNIVNGISFETFSKNLPDLPYIILDCNMASMPQSKGDKKKVSGKFIDNLNPSRSFSFKNADADVQGTSSAGYPRKNYKFKFKKGFTAINDSTKPNKAGINHFIGVNDEGTWKNFKMTEDAVGASTYTFKADYASSEGANNVELVRLYNDLSKSVGIYTPPQSATNGIRVGIDGFPMAIFTTEKDGSHKFVGKYNFNNDKGTEKVYGLNYHKASYDEDTYQLITTTPDFTSKDPVVATIPDESWETGDNSSVYTRWHDYPTKNFAFTLLGNSGKGDGIYEVRFPSEWQDAHDKTSTESMNHKRFVDLMKWVSSTDTNDYNDIDFPRGVKAQYVKLPDAWSHKSLSDGDSLSGYYIKEQKQHTERSHPVAKALAGKKYYSIDDNGVISDEPVSVNIGDDVSNYLQQVITEVISYKKCEDSDIVLEGEKYYSDENHTQLVTPDVGSSAKDLYIMVKTSEYSYITPEAIAEANITYCKRAYDSSTNSYVYTPVSNIEAGKTVVNSYYVSKFVNGDVYTRLESGTYKSTDTREFYFKTGEKLGSAVQFGNVYIEATVDLYEKDADGNDVTDDNGNPKPMQVPSYYVRLSDGSYILVSQAVANKIVIPGRESYSDTADNKYFTLNVQTGVTYYTSTSPTFYYDDADYRKTKFTQELTKYFDLDSTVFYYVFTEFFLQIDSRVKNSFPTYFAITKEEKKSKDVWKALDPTTQAEAGKEYYYKTPVYTEFTNVLSTGSSVSGLKKLDESTGEFIDCESNETAILGVKYYNIVNGVNTDVSSTVTYPTDITKYFVKNGDDYVQATFPVVSSNTYYSMDESGEPIYKNNFTGGELLNDHTWYGKVSEDYTEVSEETSDINGVQWPKGRWTWLPYDMDTSLGINNEGALVFSYNLEDTDIIYGTTEVYNGQDSVLWNNLRECFNYEISSMYATLRSTRQNNSDVFSYDVIEGMFDDHQYHWPANLFNEDSYYKYIIPLIDPEIDPTTNKQFAAKNYLEMAQGSKEQQRKWWMFNRFRYIDSKYTAADSNNKFIYFRAYNGGTGRLNIIPYSDIYVHFLIGRAIREHVRASRNESVPISIFGFEPNDTETYIYSADLIKEIQGLSDLMIDKLDISSATRLQKLQIDGFHWKRNMSSGELDFDPIETNEKFSILDLSQNVNLIDVRVTNCPALVNSGDMTKLTKLKKLNLLGNENMTAVTLPVSGVLEEVILPSSISQLVINGQNSINKLMIAKRCKEVEGSIGESIWEEINDDDKVELTYSNGMVDKEISHRYVDVNSSYLKDKNTLDLDRLVFVNSSSKIQDQILNLMYNMGSSKAVRFIGFTFTFNTNTEIQRFFNKLDELYFVDSDGTVVSYDRKPTDASNAINGTLTADWSEGATPLTISYADMFQYTSKFKSVIMDYNVEKTVKFHNVDGSILQTKTVVTRKTTAGVVTYDGSVENSKPSKEDTRNTHYSFVGWTDSKGGQVKWDIKNFVQNAPETFTWREYDAISNVTQDINGITKDTDLYPVFIKTNIYTVSFYGYRGNEEDLYFEKRIIDVGSVSYTLDDINGTNMYNGHKLESPIIVNTSEGSREVQFNGWASEPYGGVVDEWDSTSRTINDVDKNISLYESYHWPISNIRINNEDKLPKILYYEGEQFDRSSIVIEAQKTFINNQGTTITKWRSIGSYEYTIEPDSPITLGISNISFQYEGKYTSLDIFVASEVNVTKDNSGNEILPEKAYYILNNYGITENFEPAGLSLTVTYDGNYKKYVTINITEEKASDYITWDPTYFTSVGLQSVLVTLKNTNLSTTISASVLRARTPQTGIFIDGETANEQYSWSEIKSIAMSGQAPLYWKVGSEKIVEFDQPNSSLMNATKFSFRILGYDHNTDVETGGRHTITFGLAKRYGVTTTGYEYCTGTTLLYHEATSQLIYPQGHSKYDDYVKEPFECISNGEAYVITVCKEIYDMLPEEIKNVMISVKKYQSDIVNNDGTYWTREQLMEERGSNTTYHKWTSSLGSIVFGDSKTGVSPVFIPSLMELLGEPRHVNNQSSDESYNSSCKQFDYYKYGVHSTYSDTGELNILPDSQNTYLDLNGQNRLVNPLIAKEVVATVEDELISIQTMYYTRSLQRMTVSNTESNPLFRYYNVVIKSDYKNKTLYGYTDVSSSNRTQMAIVPCFVVG